MDKRYRIFKTTTEMLFCILVLLMPATIWGQSYFDAPAEPWYMKRAQPQRTADATFNYIPKKPGHYSRSDWRAVIDSTWGMGRPTAEKLALFDFFWNEVDQKYAGFVNLDVDWDGLYAYRDTVAAGVSRGRFAGIMSHLSMALLESHTVMFNTNVALDSLLPGVPLLVIANHKVRFDPVVRLYDHGHFGAGLTPLPDSSLLVYSALPNHPLGLAPGDIVLGYDNIPWKILYKELLSAQLPVHQRSFWGSSERSFHYTMLISAGLNWHLFDTIDILKYNTADTLHLSTSVLQGQDMTLYSTLQLPVPGVPMPQDDELVSWGIVDGTQVGYIYVASWSPFSPASDGFSSAVNILMNDYETSGLIIDYRSNPGGFLDAADKGYRQLFNADINFVNMAVRADPQNRLALTPVLPGECCGFQPVPGDPNLYDRPLAVLISPTTFSAADYNTLRIKYHPMARMFGLPNGSAHTCYCTYEITTVPPFPEWRDKYGIARRNTYVIDDPDSFYIHVGVEVDEEVSLTREDVVQGHDTIVEAALSWIHNLAHAHDVAANPPYVASGADTTTINALVENPNNHPLAVHADITDQDNVILDSLQLYDDGQHGDHEAGDGFWGGFWPAPAGEETYRVNLTTEDAAAATSRTLPDAARFTTIGPVTLDAVEDVTFVSEFIYFKLFFRNNGAVATALDVNALIVPTDTNIVHVLGNNQNIGDIAPGEVSYPQVFRIETQNNPAFVTFDLHIFSEGHFFWEDSVDISVGITPPGEIVPAAFALGQNYPNPFNPNTTIDFAIPFAGHVSLKVYNSLGEEVATLVSGILTAGEKQVMWDGKDRYGKEVSSGVYIYKIET
ncbi:MAG: T9SS type A sorting domain-containing protein, partial [Calditrichaeota bacterium]|nr:T9SS type A sorting domain-containing protein [Calditrichota bacterium]